MEQGTRYRALKAAIRDGIESGVSDKTVPEIMEEVETRLRADAAYRLTRKSTDYLERDKDVDSKD